jgi:organic radical activating enzyme
MRGRISEIYRSVQGEGLYLGEEQLFVRFFGCNLSCDFCDTRPRSFSEYSPQELFEEIAVYQPDFHSISFTGGEPLLQKDFLKEILMLTSRNGYKNSLETNGTLAAELEELTRYIDIIAMDIKLPGSNGPSFWGLHRRFLEASRGKDIFVKIVVSKSSSEEDFLSALNLIKGFGLPLFLTLQPNSLEHDFLLEEKLDHFKYLCRMENIVSAVIPQMHKVMGVR